MAITVGAPSSATAKASGASINVPLANAISAGTWLLIVVALDNEANIPYNDSLLAGAQAIDATGYRYPVLLSAVRNAVSAGAGARLLAFLGQAQSNLASGSKITVSWSNSVTAKAAVVVPISVSAGNILTITSYTISQGVNAAPASLYNDNYGAISQVNIAMLAYEGVTSAVTYPSGWTGVGLAGTSGGGAASNITCGVAYSFATGNVQFTWGLSTSSDYVVGGITLMELPPVPSSPGQAGGIAVLGALSRNDTRLAGSPSDRSDYSIALSGLPNASGRSVLIYGVASEDTPISSVTVSDDVGTSYKILFIGNQPLSRDGTKVAPMFIAWGRPSANPSSLSISLYPSGARRPYKSEFVVLVLDHAGEPYYRTSYWQYTDTSNATSLSGSVASGEYDFDNIGIFLGGIVTDTNSTSIPLRSLSTGPNKVYGRFHTGSAGVRGVIGLSAIKHVGTNIYPSAASLNVYDGNTGVTNVGAFLAVLDVRTSPPSLGATGGVIAPYANAQSFASVATNAYANTADSKPSVFGQATLPINAYASTLDLGFPVYGQATVTEPPLSAYGQSSALADIYSGALLGTGAYGASSILAQISGLANITVSGYGVSSLDARPYGAVSTTLLASGNSTIAPSPNGYVLLYISANASEELVANVYSSVVAGVGAYGGPSVLLNAYGGGLLGVALQGATSISATTQSYSLLPVMGAGTTSVGVYIGSDVTLDTLTYLDRISASADIASVSALANEATGVADLGLHSFVNLDVYISALGYVYGPYGYTYAQGDVAIASQGDAQAAVYLGGITYVHITSAGSSYAHAQISGYIGISAEALMAYGEVALSPMANGYMATPIGAIGYSNVHLATDASSSVFIDAVGYPEVGPVTWAISSVDALAQANITTPLLNLFPIAHLSVAGAGVTSILGQINAQTGISTLAYGASELYARIAGYIQLDTQALLSYGELSLSPLATGIGALAIEGVGSGKVEPDAGGYTGVHISVVGNTQMGVAPYAQATLSISSYGWQDLFLRHVANADVRVALQGDAMVGLVSYFGQASMTNSISGDLAWALAMPGSVSVAMSGHGYMALTATLLGNILSRGINARGLATHYKIMYTDTQKLVLKAQVYHGVNTGASATSSLLERAETQASLEVNTEASHED